MDDVEPDVMPVAAAVNAESRNVLNSHDHVNHLNMISLPNLYLTARNAFSQLNTEYETHNARQNRPGRGEYNVHSPPFHE
jgi:hypothetical protein